MGLNVYTCCNYFIFRLEYWKRSGYTSLNVVVNSDSEEEEGVWSDGDEDGQGSWSGEINYVMGDVTHPQNTGTGDVIIVHCVGEYCVRVENNMPRMGKYHACAVWQEMSACLPSSYLPKTYNIFP